MTPTRMICRKPLSDAHLRFADLILSALSKTPPPAEEGSDSA